MTKITQKLINTNVSDKKSKFLLGQIIRKEFDTTQDEDRAFELMQLAYKYEAPQMEEMLSDYSLTDFKILF
jgi:hypothetical protein